MTSHITELPISPDLLTIILTTSPVPSCPSAALIKNTLNSLPNSLSDVPIVITFDNFTVATNDNGRLKKGCVPQDMADRYPDYIENVRQLFGNTSYSSDHLDCSVSFSLIRNATFLVLRKRNGFAFSVKIALNYVKTPYILILQHDWCFTFHPPISHLLSILHNEEDVQYIGFLARMSLNYVTSKAHSHSYYRYIFSQARSLRLGRPLSDDLVACLHWFDRPHLCSTEIYRQIFSMSIIKQGDFIEDTFGTEYIKSMINAPSREVAFEQWKRWSAWMYYPDDGKTVTIHHQHGRLNLLGEKQEEKIKKLIQSNMNKRAAQTSEDKRVQTKDDEIIDELYIDFN